MWFRANKNATTEQKTSVEGVWSSVADKEYSECTHVLESIIKYDGAVSRYGEFVLLPGAVYQVHVVCMLHQGRTVPENYRQTNVMEQLNTKAVTHLALLLGKNHSLAENYKQKINVSWGVS